jgi:hypothetical protein
MTPPPPVSAQGTAVPTETEVTPLVRPVTCTGVAELVVVMDPFPSSPMLLSPQHMTAPLAVSAHAELLPTETEVMPLVRPVTGTGTKLLVVPPKRRPQHMTAPPAVTAQAVEVVTDTDVTPLVRPVTCTGTELFVVEPFPSKPETA